MTMGVHDEVVVVFGGSSGIGEAVARTMAARGSQVIIVGRDPGRLAAASGRLGGAVRTAAVDASDRDAVDAFFPAWPGRLTRTPAMASCSSTRMSSRLRSTDSSVPSEIRPVAQLILSICPGFVAQRSLTGDADVQAQAGTLAAPTTARPAETDGSETPQVGVRDTSHSASG